MPDADLVGVKGSGCPAPYVIARSGTGRPGLVALATTTLKTLSKKQQQQQQKNRKQNQEQLNSSTIACATEQPEQEQAQKELSGYESYYNKLSEEVETIERHVGHLRQTPGLEHLTEAEAQKQVDFMLRFSAWIFNQHQQEQQIAFIADVVHESAKVSKVQKPKGQRNKKVTESLSH